MAVICYNPLITNPSPAVSPLHIRLFIRDICIRKGVQMENKSENTVYGNVFWTDEETAMGMARLTRGYSFAFQVLGYFTWENRKHTERILDDYRQYLEDYVYEKIWAELSKGDKRILFGIARSASGKISEIREILRMETNQFNPYRKRLIKKGIIFAEARGYVRFVLPMFEQFVLENYFEIMPVI